MRLWAEIYAAIHPERHTGQNEKSSPLILSRFEIFAGVLVSFGSFLVRNGSFSPVRASGSGGGTS